MVDTYKGDSVAKKCARVTVWDCVGSLLSEEEFCRGRHLVLASREGGDIACLLAKGVSADKIIAVDREETAVAACRQKYPGVRVLHGDVTDVAKRFRRTFVSAHLDFCAPLSETLFSAIADVAAHGLKNQAVLSYSGLAGRESPEQRSWLRAHLEAKEEITKQALLVRSGALDVAQFQNGMEMDREDADLVLRRMSKIGAHVLREEAAANAIEAALAKRCLNSNLYASIYYQSRTERNAGVPILTMVHAVDRDGSKFSSHESCTLVPPKRFRYVGPVRSHKAQLLSWANESPDENWPGLLNISSRTWAAWKAHGTMGTYNLEEAYASDS